MQQGQDPRATVIKNLSEQQQLIDEVLKEIPPIQQITFDILMQAFQKCFEIRQQPEFIEAIFNKNDIYEEFVMWILNPVGIIEKRKLLGDLVSQQSQRKYPYTCMKIAKDNNLFYIHLYLKAYFDQKALKLWFQFLSNINMDTFYTSLGYFTQIMMPFLKYEFSQCTKICQELMESCDQDFLMSSSVIHRQQTPVSKQRLLMSNKKKKNDVQKQISILTLFTDELLEFIFNFIQHEAVFKFIHNLILVSLQQTDLKRSKKVFEAFLKKALEKDKSQTSINLISSIQKAPSWLQREPLMDICVEYILQVVKEIYDNANTQKNYRVIFFIDSLVRLDIIGLFIQRIQQSPLMVKQLGSQEKLTGSVDFTAIINEQDYLQYYIKSLTLMVRIFSKMSRNKRSDEQKERESKYFGSSSESQDEATGENKVMKEFSLQIGNIFNKLPQLSQLVKKSQSRVVAFSSGQNIKPITMCKYEFFQLLYTCLLLSKEFPQGFVLDTEKINIFSIIERYLNENRWNNLAHKVLEKIACLLIINNKNFFRTKEMNKNNMADEFLNTIIESFTNKKHIFLKSLRFTTQGNLHTLYTIAKAIINKLKQTHNLANFVHQLDYYKKFVMNDLQQYEKKIKQIQYPADQQDIIIDNKNAQENDQVKLYIDQLSVSEIVKKIDMVNKWPLKQTKRKHGSFIHRSLSYMSDQHHHHQPGSSILERKKRPPPPSQQLLNTQDQEDSDSTNKIKSLATSPRLMTKSQHRDFSKTAEQGSGFFKQSMKKTDSILLSPLIGKHEGHSVFGDNNNSKNLKDKISIQLFGQNPYNINEEIEQFRYNDIKDSQFLSEHQQRMGERESRTQSCPVSKKNSLKESEGAQDFMNMCKSNSNSNSENNEGIVIQVIGSDHKMRKSTSIDDKTGKQGQELKKFNSTQ